MVLDKHEDVGKRVGWSVFFLLLAAIGFGIYKIQEYTAVVTKESPAQQPSRAPFVAASVERAGNVVSGSGPVSAHRRAVPVQQGKSRISESAALKDIVPNQEGSAQVQPVSEEIMNAVPARQQVAANITAQNQQRLAREKIESDRLALINKVHQSIVGEGGQTVFDQHKAVVPPLLEPPDRIVQDIRSNRLTAH
ncbi:MAG: hypothetical protein HQL19_00870 [Candidatus Omnitrophica bacterium]|nr:hypothetical protein [Candidatus Omnitrophota bacterium]